jgi:hypothetical protein
MHGTVQLWQYQDARYSTTVTVSRCTVQYNCDSIKMHGTVQLWQYRDARYRTTVTVPGCTVQNNCHSITMHGTIQLWHYHDARYNTTVTVSRCTVQYNCDSITMHGTVQLWQYQDARYSTTVTVSRCTARLWKKKSNKNCNSVSKERARFSFLLRAALSGIFPIRFNWGHLQLLKDIDNVQKITDNVKRCISRSTLKFQIYK